jgi:hypothetical protein
MVRVFLFNPFSREKIIKYEQISIILFIDLAVRGEFPRLVVSLKEHNIKKSRFNIIYFVKRSKRVEITKFLLSKNVEMETCTSYPKRNKKIIDLVKAKYPKNVHIPQSGYLYKPIGYI